MTDNFYHDMIAAKPAEILVRLLLEQQTNRFTFENVGTVREYRYKGDIKGTHKATGECLFVEVKDDSRIADTQNVLCEEANYYFDSGREVKGGMWADYEFYAIVSQKERKVYFLDFDVLKRIYRIHGYSGYKQHEDNISYFYTLPLQTIKECGGLLGILEYDEELSQKAHKLALDYN